MSRLLQPCDCAAEPPERYRHDIFDRGFESDLTDVAEYYYITAVKSSVMLRMGLAVNKSLESAQLIT